MTDVASQAVQKVKERNAEKMRLQRTARKPSKDGGDVMWQLVPDGGGSGRKRRYYTAGHRRSRKTTAFHWHEDADCPPNIQLFLGQDLCSCWHTSLEQFAVRLTKNRVIILPVQAVAGDIFIWTVRPPSIVNFFDCAVLKYSYLLT